MSIKVQDKVIADMVAQHALWIAADDQNPGRRAVFTGMNLTSYDFTSDDLSRADFTGANCAACTFTCSRKAISGPTTSPSNLAATTPIRACSRVSTRRRPRPKVPARFPSCPTPRAGCRRRRCCISPRCTLRASSSPIIGIIASGRFSRKFAIGCAPVKHQKRY